MSSTQSGSTTGEGSSSGAAAADPPLTALIYLKSLEKLPSLIKAILDMPEELERVSKRLCELPIKRQLSFRRFKYPTTRVEFDATNNSHIGTVKPHYNVTALLVFLTGDEIQGDEACCNWENKPTCARGIFPLSVIPIEADYDVLTSSESIETPSRIPGSPSADYFAFPCTEKACANCQYDGMGSKCPLQITENKATRAMKVEKRKASQLDGHIDDENDVDEEEVQTEEDNDA